MFNKLKALIQAERLLAGRPRTARHKRFFLNAAFVAFLSQWAGCTSVPPLPSDADFSIRGKIGVVDGGNSWSARFLWRQFGDRFEIDLWGPLGQGQTHLRGTPSRLEIIDADGLVRTSGNPEALMFAELGWSLPLGLLLDWLQGRPAAEAPVTDAIRNPDGGLTRFRQLGWEVRLERAKKAPPDAPLRRITAEKPGYRVRMVVSERGV